MRYRGYEGFRLSPILFLIILNLIVFIATLISPQLYLILGLRPATFFQQPWTVLTNLFVHGGFSHFLTNMITLFFFGTFLTKLIGENKLLITYFGGGILGNILFMFLSPPFVLAIGASGAVFALGGSLTVLVPKLRVFIFPIPVQIPLWIAVIGGFLILSFIPGIAWQAHLGGLAFGFVAGYIFKRGQRYYYR
jgi:membrane associated rhomboid family serine protease